MQTLIIGLTGQTGAGKSTLSGMFSEQGVEVINADLVARETMETSKSCLMELVLAFSTEVIHPDATLNREKLAEICFGDRQKLKRLNEITFPYIIAAIRERIELAKAKGAPFVLLDAPTLFESGMDRDCDRVIAVIADEQSRFARIVARDDMTEEAARRRIGAQGSDTFYTGRADDVITNNGDLDSLRLCFCELYGRLCRMAAGELPVREKSPGSDGAPTSEPGQEDPGGDLEELADKNED